MTPAGYTPIAAPQEQRTATIADLRSRIARLGGFPAGRPLCTPARVAMAPPHRRADRPAMPDPSVLGFEAEPTPQGRAWVRRVSIDLGPYLERAGAEAPVAPAQLVRLSGRDWTGLGPGWTPSTVAVLDIESLGLRGSGVLAFLVGVGVPRGDRLDLDQLLVADPGEEVAMLHALLARLAGCRVLVTYNGRSFDAPVLRSRCIVNRLSPAVFEELIHCDLLASVRRLFRDRIGGCTLAQAEVELLAFERVDDVPGYEAPARYRTWLRGGDSPLLDGVVRHNQLDCCSTMVLAARIAAHLEGALVAPHHPADRYRLGVHLEREGVEEGVGEHYHVAWASGRGPWDRQAAQRLARRAERDHGAAAGLEIWRSLCRGDPRDLAAAQRLAIALERTGELVEARAVARQALGVSRALAPWMELRLRGRPREGWIASWERRLQRLERRVRRSGQTGAHTPPGLLEVVVSTA